MENQLEEKFIILKLFGKIIVIKLFGKMIDLRSNPPTLQLPSLPAKRSNDQIISRIAKKAKRNEPPNEPPQLPPIYIDELLRMGVTIDDQNPKFVCKRTLYESDIKKQQNRLTVYKKFGEVFLSPDQLGYLSAKCDSGKPNKIDVKVIDPKLVTRDMSLAKWGIPGGLVDLDARKNKGWFALNNAWWDVAEENGFGVGDVLQIWSFRVGDDKLGFLIHMDPAYREKVEGSSSSNRNNSSGNGSGGGRGSGSGGGSGSGSGGGSGSGSCSPVNCV